MTLHDHKGREIEGVTMSTQHTVPEQEQMPAWCTLSIKGGEYDVEVIDEG